MHARPDANIIRRNIDMHALTEVVRIAAPTTGAPRAGTSIAPLRRHACQLSGSWSLMVPPVRTDRSPTQYVTT